MRPLLAEIVVIALVSTATLAATPPSWPGTILPRITDIHPPRNFAAAAGDLTGDGRDDLVFVLKSPLVLGWTDNLVVIRSQHDGFEREVIPFSTRADSVAIGDLNHDGYGDIAVLLGGQPASVQVFFQSPSGEFVPTPPNAIGQAIGRESNWIEVVDLNGDGRLEAVVSAQSDLGSITTLSWLPGATNPTRVTSSPSGPVVHSPVFLDLNSDGRLDIVGVSHESSQSRIFAVLSEGESYLPHTVVRPLTTGRWVIADANGDRTPDFVLANGSESYAELLGEGDPQIVLLPHLPPNSIGLPVRGGRADDLGREQVLYVSQNGSGAFRSVPLLGDQAQQSSGHFDGASYVNHLICDLNGDQLDDIVSHSNKGFAAWFPAVAGSASSAPFRSQIISNGLVGSLVRTPDLNNDGLPDLLVANNFARYSLSLPGGGLGEPVQLQFSPGVPLHGDLTGEGFPELVWLANSNFFVIHPNTEGFPNSSQAIKQVLLGPSTNNVHGGFIADIDADGNNEIVIATSAAIAVVDFAEPLTPAVSYYPSIASNPVGINPIDFNRDGAIDVIFAHNGQLRVMLNNGQGVLSPPVTVISQATVTGVQPRSIAVGDIDADGYEDVVATLYTSSLEPLPTAMIFWGGPDGLSDGQPLVLGARISTVSIVDTDGDGKLDLLFVQSQSWMNPGAIVIAVQSSLRQFFPITEVMGAEPGSVRVADMNADGSPDLVVGGRLRILYGAPPPCPADLTADGSLNFFDIARAVALFNAGDPAIDLAEPFGTINFFDLAAYLNLFNAGCP